MEFFLRAATYTAGYVFLAGLGSGAAGTAALSGRALRRGDLGRWLFWRILSVMPAAVLAVIVRGSPAFYGPVWACGCFAVALFVLFSRRRPGFWSNLLIPLSVFVSSAGFGLPAALMIGGMAGLALAGAAELLLNPGDAPDMNRSLCLFAAAAFAVLGLVHLI